MESIRKVLGELRNDDFRYGLLDDGDKIVVGISPNIASLTFLSVLFDYSRFQKKRFEVKPLLINTGFENERLEEVSSFVKSRGYELEIFDAVIPFENSLHKKRGTFSHPIYTRFVKGALFDYAHEHGYNKIVLCQDLLDLRIVHHLGFQEDASLSLLPIKEIDNERRVTLIRPFLFLDHEIILDAAIKKDVPAPAREVIAKGERYEKAESELSPYISFASFKKRIAMLDTYLKDEELGDESCLPYTLHRVRNAFECARYLQFEKEAVIPHFSEKIEYYLIYQNHMPIGQVTLEKKTAHDVNILSFYAPERNEGIEKLLLRYISGFANPMNITSFIPFSFYEKKRPDESGLYALKVKR